MMDWNICCWIIVLKLALLVNWTTSQNSSSVVPVLRPSTASPVLPRSSAIGRTTPGCGGHLSSTSGRFTTPGFPSNYPGSTVCTWTVNLTAGSMLSIEFDQFSTEPCCDFASIRYGSFAERFSGNRGSFSATPVTAPTNNTRVTIRFNSDRSGSRRGFTARFTISPLPGQTSSSSGAFVTSSEISSTPINIITTSFASFRTSSMAIHSSSPTHFLSAVTQSTAESITPLTSRPTVLSSSPDVTPLDTSSQASSPVSVTIATTTQPFSSSVIGIQPTSTPVPTQPPFLGCGGIMNGSAGSFGTPGFPGRYDNDLTCTWTLRVPADGGLRLTFSEFHTEACCDYVELTDDQGQRIRLVSGNRPSFTVNVRGNTSLTVRVQFTSDQTVRRSGFLAHYVITSPPRTTHVTTLAVATTTLIPVTSSWSAAPTTLRMTTTVVPSASTSIPETTASSAAPTTLRMPTTVVTSSSSAAPTTLRMPTTVVTSSSSAASTTLRMPTTVVTSSSLAASTTLRMPTTVVPSASSSIPVAPSSVTPPIILTRDVRRLLQQILRSLREIIKKVEDLLGSQFSSVQIETFKNETLVIIQEIERQLAAPVPSPRGNDGLAKRAIQDSPSDRQLMKLLERVQRRLGRIPGS